MENKMEKIISLCKRRGFIYPGSEIYGGLAGTYDYGPLGVSLKNNIKKIWWKRFVDSREDMYGIDAAIIMNPEVWKASGHVGGFSDPMVECYKCHRRYRADHIAQQGGNVDATNMQQVLNFITLVILNKTPEAKEKFPDVYETYEWKCESCGINNNFKTSIPREFNMMFQTHVGAIQDDSSIAYLRPETAGGMFVNFKNIMDSIHPKLPFGMAQIGKAFRNEIAPRDFIFRVREFEQMEIEYFVHPNSWEENFEILRKEMHGFMNDLGLEKSSIHEVEVSDEDRAFYSKRTIDIEFDFPFGQKELYGLAYRTDYDLSAHQKGSTKDLTYFDEESKERFIPHVIEPSFGLDRTVLAVLANAYKEDSMNGETREYLALVPGLAPYRVCVSPLLKNKKEQQDKAREIFMMLKNEFGNVAYDDNGNVGKRYRRQDEIGTPYCVVIDFDTTGTGTDVNPDNKDTVTIRHRDTGLQERVSIDTLVDFIRGK
jgi:glycyl-tRNA synthetase